MNEHRFRVPLRIVFYREDDQWVAHCLEFDLCGIGATKRESIDSLGEMIYVQLKDSIEHKNLRNLFSPAPSEIQEKFFKGSDDRAEGGLELKIQPVDDIDFSRQEYRVYVDTVSDCDSGLVPAQLTGFEFMGRPRLKLHDFLRIMASFGVENESGTKHIKLYKQLPDGYAAYPFPKPKGGQEVANCYVNGARRKFLLTPERGVTDEEFFSR